MNDIVFMAYEPTEAGHPPAWRIIDAESFHAPLKAGDCRVWRNCMAGGAQLRIRTSTAAVMLDTFGEPQIGQIAARWLVTNGLVEKRAGQLVPTPRLEQFAAKATAAA